MNNETIDDLIDFLTEEDQEFVAFFPENADTELPQESTRRGNARVTDQKHVIEVCGRYTGFTRMQFGSDISRTDALHQAAATKRAWYAAWYWDEASRTWMAKPPVIAETTTTPDPGPDHDKNIMELNQKHIKEQRSKEAKPPTPKESS